MQAILTLCSLFSIFTHGINANGKKVITICVCELESTQGFQNYNAGCDIGVHYCISFKRHYSVPCDLFVDAALIKANADPITKSSKNSLAYDVRNQSSRRDRCHVTFDGGVRVFYGGKF
jgi:hypothetical protein